MSRNIRILVIGTEITNGYVQDSNTQFFARELGKAGRRIIEICTLPDDETAVLQKLESWVTTGDLIITTGGLGPTDDDLTVNILSKLTKSKICHDAEAIKKIDLVFNSNYKGKMPEEQAKSLYERLYRQTRILENSEALKNPVGLAPGIYIKDIPLIALPGFPMEIEGIWPYAENVLEKLKIEKTETYEIPLWGVSESYIFENITFPKEIEVGVHSLGWGSKIFLRSQNKSLLKETYNVLEKTFYGHLLDNPIVEYFNYLKANKLTLGTVESCTGGLLGQLITDFPGSSDVFLGGIISYSNIIKENLCSVPKEILLKHGAVSHETAWHMAKGGLEKLNTDFAIALTGIAGPGGGSDEKPVGTLYIALASKSSKEIAVAKLLYPYGRTRFRMAAAYTAFLASYQKDILYPDADSWLKSRLGKKFTIS